MPNCLSSIYLLIEACPPLSCRYSLSPAGVTSTGQPRSISSTSTFLWAVWPRAVVCRLISVWWCSSILRPIIVMSLHESTKDLSQEEIVVSSKSDDSQSLEVGVDERRLMRRIDWHVVPWLALLYLLNFLDRGNIGNARVSRISHSRILPSLINMSTSCIICKTTCISRTSNT